MKTRPIGERFTIDGQEYEVVEERRPPYGPCEGCSFANRRPCRRDAYVRPIRGYCADHDRTDGKSVIFVKVNK